MVTPLQGDVWWAETEDKRRPVLILTRSEAIPVLTRIVVAPITRTVRGIPTELPVGPAEGLPDACVASFDNLQALRISFLTERIGTLAHGRDQICLTLRAFADC